MIRCNVPANLGKIVRVIEEAVPTPGFESPDGHGVWMRPDGYWEAHVGRLSWFVESEGAPFRCEAADGSVIADCVGMYPDDHLRPLRFKRGPDEMLEIAVPPHLHGVKA